MARIRERVLGPRLADLASALCILGDVLIRSERHAEAVPFLERWARPRGWAPQTWPAPGRSSSSLTIREKVLGSADQQRTDGIVGLASR